MNNKNQITHRIESIFLKSNLEIKSKIDELILRTENGSEKIKIAVAFWGRGSDTELKKYKEKKYKIICNISIGGSNKETIRALKNNKNIELKHLPELHAKVFIAGSKAIIGSMNFSENGLGYNEKNKGWIETAVCTDSRAAHEWFDELWLHAIEVEDKDIDSMAESFFHEHKIDIKVDWFEIFRNEFSSIEMASDKLEKLHGIKSKRDTHEVKVPAYAANLISVKSGVKIQYFDKKEGVRRYFNNTLDIYKRIINLNEINKIKDVIELLKKIVNSNEFKYAVRYWANKCIDDYQENVENIEKYRYERKKK